ncbi:ATP-dependent helicase [Cohnella fermenti]|uniref:DNA 3'-5' helicase n=1 Tax=Cohnella fermenti TaxID=2565925 RepID=A0A4S4C878_9BACL|nr:ATP-dependent helicase [Cohnella fermenti]THF83542.1 ATP-dependent helicase [Cohnella fermenti]
MQGNEEFFTRKREELGVELNEVQKKAVLHTEGALLLLASPGSGKTTTLIMRIGYLVEEKGVRPERIKAVTFSRASARDMKERFDRFFPKHSGERVAFSTIHSLAFEMMRDSLRKQRIDYRIIEGDAAELEEDVDFAGERPPLHKKLILRELYRRIVGDHMTDDQMDELTTYISFVKNKLLPQEEWGAVKCEVADAERLLAEYERFKREGADKRLIDYDDMLVLANEALDADRELLRKYQRRYDYVMTDESQDTSLVQHAIVEKLVQGHGNLCVVADDDQSIYAWRAAEPQYLLDFKKAYPRARLLKMEQNYRSSRNIVQVANRFIKRNKNRYDKNMFTDNPEAEPIVVHRLSDYQLQAKFVAERVAEEDNLREIAVLYRNNSSSIALLNAFDRAGILFYMKDGDNRFFSHWVVEDVLNFMRMTFTDRRPDILEKIHSKMNGYITKQQMAALKAVPQPDSVFDNLMNYVSLRDYQFKLLQECKETFERMKGMAPRDAIQTIRYDLGYEKAIDKMCERLGFRKEYLIGILNTLEDIAEGLETMEAFAHRLKYLEQVMKTARRRRSDNAVTFSTLHSAKGLEFERVLIVDLVDGILPSNDDIKKHEEEDAADMEEAVRLFYVGMTRAKRRLELCAYDRRDGTKTKVSRFVNAVRRIQDPEAFQAAPGKRPAEANGESAGRAHEAFAGGERAMGGQAPGRGRAAASAAASTRRPPGKATVVRIDNPRAKATAARNPNAVREAALLAVGSAVEHRSFGRGRIERLRGDHAVVRFEAGQKTLSVSACLEMGLLELKG